MRPSFSLTSDSVEPGVTGCTATWEVNGKVTNVHFPSNVDAFAINKVVEAAYWAGIDKGRDEVSRAVISTARTYMDDYQ